MSFRRYEIILPTRYNDGALVEAEKILGTAEELVAQFGSVTYQPEHLHGIWTHQGHRYEEDNVRIFVDVEDTENSAAFFRRFKETLRLDSSRWIFGSCLTKFGLPEWRPYIAR